MMHQNSLSTRNGTLPLTSETGKLVTSKTIATASGSSGGLNSSRHKMQEEQVRNIALSAIRPRCVPEVCNRLQQRVVKFLSRFTGY
jgi:hypothetical protein